MLTLSSTHSIAPRPKTPRTAAAHSPAPFITAAALTRLLLCFLLPILPSLVLLALVPSGRIVIVRIVIVAAAAAAARHAVCTALRCGSACALLLHRRVVRCACVHVWSTPARSPLPVWQHSKVAVRDCAPPWHWRGPLQARQQQRQSKQAVPPCATHRTSSSSAPVMGCHEHQVRQEEGDEQRNGSRNEHRNVKRSEKKSFSHRATKVSSLLSNFAFAANWSMQGEDAK